MTEPVDLDALDRLIALDRCDWCGWPIGPREMGCAADSCSQRPLPFIAPDVLHRRQLRRAAHAELRDARAERDAARIALGGHAAGDFAGDDGCGCTMLGLVRLCETHHDWLQSTKRELDAARAELADYRDGAARVLAGQCAPDEKHCTCVPALRAELARRDAELREARVLLSKAVPRLAAHLRHARARNELDALQATNDLADIRAFLEARP